MNIVLFLGTIDKLSFNSLVRHPKLQKGFLEMTFVAVSQWDQKIPKALLMDFEDDEETLGEIEVQSIKLLDKILIRLIKHIDDVTYAGMGFCLLIYFTSCFIRLYS